VLNDPVNLVDPSGQFGFIVGLGAGALAGAIVGAVDVYLNANNLSEANSIFWTNVAIGAMAGVLGSSTGFLGAVAGEVGGIGLNALTGLNGVPIDSSKNDSLECNK